MQIYEIYFKSIYNECVIYVLLTVLVVEALKYIAFGHFFTLLIYKN